MEVKWTVPNDRLNGGGRIRYWGLEGNTSLLLKLGAMEETGIYLRFSVRTDQILTFCLCSVFFPFLLKKIQTFIQT